MIDRRLLLGSFAAAAGAAAGIGIWSNMRRDDAPITRDPRPASRWRAEPPAGARTHSPIDLRIDTDGVWANPFDPREVDLTVTCTGPGTAFTVPAFYYQHYDADAAPVGEPEWRARLTVTEPGRYDLSFREHRGGASFDAALDVEEALGRGFLRLDEAGTGFAFEDGTRFVPVGANISWSTEPTIPAWIADFERWFAGMAAAGGNATRIWMAPWGFAPEWDDTPLGDYTTRLDRAWALDEVFRLAERHDIQIMLTLLNHGQFSETTNPEWDQNPYNAANGGMLASPGEFATDPEARRLFAQRVRYIAARWGAWPQLWAWEWWNEVNYTPITDSLLRPWIEEMSAVVAEHDPYEHLRTTSYGSDSPTGIWDMPELDFATTHRYNETDPARRMRGWAEEEIANAQGKPIVLSEFGAAIAADDAAIDTEAVHWHNGMWAAVLAGFHGPSLYWWWDEYIEPHGLWTALEGIAAFVEGEELAAYEPVDVATEGPVVAMASLADDRALLWVRDERYHAGLLQEDYTNAVRAALRDGSDVEWTPEFAAVTGAEVRFAAPGEWRADWYSAIDGTPLGSTEVVDGVVAVPSVDRSIAAKLVRR